MRSEHNFGGGSGYNRRLEVSLVLGIAVEVSLAVTGVIGCCFQRWGALI